jgi:hypothetical protein
MTRGALVVYTRSSASDRVVKGLLSDPSQLNLHDALTST